MASSALVTILAYVGVQHVCSTSHKACIAQDDGDVRLARLRRAAGYEEDGTFNPALLDIEALLGGGEDGPEEGAEEGAWLRAFKRRKALADLSVRAGYCMMWLHTVEHPGHPCVPHIPPTQPDQAQRGEDAPQSVDERSQLVAELLQGASNSQGALARAGSGASNGSGGSGRAPLARQSSFLSRAGSAPKGTGISMINVTAGNSRSYVFGRDEASREGGKEEDHTGRKVGGSRVVL